jgi:hypothetical protein
MRFVQVTAFDSVATACGQTHRRARIGVNIVTIVARLALINLTIATCGQSAIIQAVVGLVFVPVIAPLMERCDLSISAAAKLTIQYTVIGVVFISIVTLLKAHQTRAYIKPSITISTPRFLAVVRAGIKPVVVAIIALLFPVFEAITAGRDEAGPSALVGVDRVTVIALLVRLLAGLHIDPPDPITTDRQRAAVRTRVRIDRVAVIASLTRLLNTITAANAAAIAATARVGVTVIALLIVRI